MDSIRQLFHRLHDVWKIEKYRRREDGELNFGWPTFVGPLTDAKFSAALAEVDDGEVQAMSDDAGYEADENDSLLQGDMTTLGDYSGDSEEMFDGIDYPFDRSQYLHKLVADFSLAIADDETASYFYTMLMDQVMTTRQHSVGDLDFAAAEHILLVLCVRSADQPTCLAKAKSLISKFKHAGLNDRDQLLFSLLEDYLDERDDTIAPNTICGRLSEMMALTDLEKVPELSHEYTSMDMIKFLLLSQSLEKLAKSSTYSQSAGADCKDAILNAFICKQPFYKKIESGYPCCDQMALPSCLEWCSQTLRDHSLIVPTKIQLIPEDSARKHSLWRENIMLFCTLWDHMLRHILKELPAWYMACEKEMGIPGAELLCTICWLVSKASANMRGNHEEQAGVARNTRSAHRLAAATSVFTRASRAIEQVIAPWPPQTLWNEFIKQFAASNTLDTLNDEGKVFQMQVFLCARDYISSKLGVELPLLTNVEPHLLTLRRS